MPLTWEKVLYSQNELKNIKDILNDPMIDFVNLEFMNRFLTSKYLNNRLNYNLLDKYILERLNQEFFKRSLEIKNDMALITNEQNKKVAEKILEFPKKLKSELDFCELKINQIESRLLSFDKETLNKSRAIR